jgi:hypothetical protein
MRTRNSRPTSTKSARSTSKCSPLGLGQPLVLAFARQVLPNDFDEIRFIFGKKGAKFRALLARRNAIERWHAFEQAATERALRAWCEAHSIAIAD